MNIWQKATYRPALTLETQSMLLASALNGGCVALASESTLLPAPKGGIYENPTNAKKTAYI